MQRLSDFADGEERAGSRLLDFQRLVAATLNQTGQAVQYFKRNLRRLMFGRLQSIDDLSGFFGIVHAAVYSAASLRASITSSTLGGDIGRL
jgi:hypothetical protein